MKQGAGVVEIIMVTLFRGMQSAVLNVRLHLFSSNMSTHTNHAV